VQRRVSYVSVPPDVWALARAFAAVLGETMPPPLRLITRVVDRLGPARARALLGQALTVEAQGSTSRTSRVLMQGLSFRLTVRPGVGASQRGAPPRRPCRPDGAGDR